MSRDALLFFSVFVASAVEGVEAVTIVLAAGLTRGWRSAWTGVASALVVLAAIVAALGPALTALPINVGGRPLLSWPSFLPVTFELAVLFSALSMLGGLFILNEHPEPYHPVFNVASFARATRDRFFLCIQSEDAHFDDEETRVFLRGLGAREIVDVPE